MLDADSADDEDDEEAKKSPDQPPDWMQPLQTLSKIPNVQLRVEWVGKIYSVDHPFISLWLKQHGQLISHLTMEIFVRNDRDLTHLRDFCEAAAPCQSVDLTISHPWVQEIDLVDLDALAGSLHRLRCSSTCGLAWGSGILRRPRAFASMSQLTGLHLAGEGFETEEPWGSLAKLTGLQELRLDVSARGDPSPLSALTGLTFLCLHSSQQPPQGLEPDGPAPFSLSSLQPLSTLRQLEVLDLGFYACAATSLQGLAGLRKLKQLVLDDCDGLVSLEGISPGVISCSIENSAALVSLAGLESCTRMESMTLFACGVSSLQPLQGLSRLEELWVKTCPLSSLEGLNGMSLQSLSLTNCRPLPSLSGVEHLSTLKSLEVRSCDVTSLQPLAHLGEGLQKLTVQWCDRVHEEVLELPYVQPIADVSVLESGNVKEVVLAGGKRMALTG
jgi:hypothetical protein